MIILCEFDPAGSLMLTPDDNDANIKQKKSEHFLQKDKLELHL